MASRIFSRHPEHREESQPCAAGPTRYAIEHVSHYHYTAPARYSVMSLCLRPRNSVNQDLLDFALTTEPLVPLSTGTDSFGNTRHVFSVCQEHDSLKITACSKVKTAPAAPLPASLGAGDWKEIHSWQDSFALWDFTHDSPLARSSPALTAFIEREGIRPAADPLQALQQLSKTLHDVFVYVPGSTTVASPVEHILESGRGVCQDYAHVMIAIARSWGVPSRYVSGYIYVWGADGEQAPQAATHAWVECRLPSLGWVGFDPTNESPAADRHVRIAVGRDYQDVPPSKGVLQGNGASRLEVDVRIRQLAQAEA